MKKNVLNIILSLILLIGLSCMCNDFFEKSILEEYYSYELIIKGSVIKKDLVDLKGNNDNDSLTNKSQVIRNFIKVEKIYRNMHDIIKTNDTIYVLTHNINSDDCDYRFQLNKDYIIYNYSIGINSFPYSKNSIKCINYENMKYFFYTNDCTRTQLFNKKENSLLLKIDSIEKFITKKALSN